VNNAARILQLDPYLDRLPKALSGGQRQRVAIGRSIVRDPKVYLFDEPLSNLDAALRVATRIEIAQLKESMPDSTMIYVTHDQVEAMTLATGRIVVLANNRGIAQVGSAAGPLYEVNGPISGWPGTATFVAQFIGSPADEPAARMEIVEPPAHGFRTSRSSLCPRRARRSRHEPGDAGIPPRPAPQGLCRQRQQADRRHRMGRQILEEIITGTYQAGAVAQNGIFNNASQHWNHTQFWEMMGPGTGGMPGELESAINRSFGSVDEFKVAVLRRRRGPVRLGLVLAGEGHRRQRSRSPRPKTA
jgi:energy-coupling factor transporter ATP-binding protein EcfA2